MCGENRPSVPALRSMLGSSPRVRGKPRPPGARTCAGGLIPACAGKTNPHRRGLDAGRAHPRVCGENGDTLETVASQYGSSPRVRGKLRAVGLRLDALGLIPACAGKTIRLCSQPWDAWAHPRVCGENSPHPAFMYPRLGSSPRVRGKLDVPLQLTGDALAHPRVCGENAYTPSEETGTCGSSPRVRGKHSGDQHTPTSHGLIPACAGKTLSC